MKDVFAAQPPFLRVWAGQRHPPDRIRRTGRLAITIALTCEDASSGVHVGTRVGTAAQRLCWSSVPTSETGETETLVSRVRRFLTLGCGAVLFAGLRPGHRVVGWSGLSGRGATTLFSQTTPAVVASAAVVPPGICFVTITAAGGRGGEGAGGGSARGRMAARGQRWPQAWPWPRGDPGGRSGRSWQHVVHRQRRHRRGRGQRQQRREPGGRGRWRASSLPRPPVDAGRRRWSRRRRCQHRHPRGGG